MKTQTVNKVQKIPTPAKINGTSAHGLIQSITCGVNLSHPFLNSLGAHPGSHVMHISLLTYESSLHRKHDQQH